MSLLRQPQMSTVELLSIQTKSVKTVFEVVFGPDVDEKMSIKKYLIRIVWARHIQKILHRLDVEHFWRCLLVVVFEI